jgi:hypothetical protein
VTKSVVRFFACPVVQILGALDCVENSSDGIENEGALNGIVGGRDVLEPPSRKQGVTFGLGEGE